MTPQVYPRMQAVAFIKRQPAYNLLFFDYQDQRLTVGMNDEGLAIVAACDGTNSLTHVAENLSQQFQEHVEDITPKLTKFLQQLEMLQLVKYADSPSNAPVPVLGTKNYLTPEHVVLELTHRCPLRCSHCYLDAGHGPTMDFPRLSRLLGQLVDEIGLRSVQLTGGEPFLYAKLGEIVNFLTGRGVPIQITTSGIVFNESSKAVLNSLTSRRNSVQVSVDGFKQSHNNIRGNVHSFQRAMQFLDYAIDHGVRTFTATSLIGQSREEITALCAHLRDRGVTLFRLGAVSIQGRASELGRAVRWSADDVRSLLSDLKAAYETETFHVGAFEDLSLVKTNYNCGAGTKLLLVDPSFHVRPCPMTDLHLGSLDKESLESIILRGNDLLQHMHAPGKDLCGDCPLEPSCRGCFAEGYSNSHRVEVCEWFNSEKSKLRPLMASEAS